MGGECHGVRRVARGECHGRRAGFEGSFILMTLMTRPPGAGAPWTMTLPSGDGPHASGPLQWARGGSGADAPPLAACP